MTSNSIWIVDR